MTVALDYTNAKKRLVRFFEEPTPERHNVSRVIKSLRAFSDVYVFGGAVRDISLSGGTRFTSDVDLVVKIFDENGFQSLMEQTGASKNKFGGYRIFCGRWKFDVWEISKTWAFTQGLVKYQNHFSLLETTFFNWDAALYDVQESALYCREGYFSDIRRRSLEINLVQNPNALGALTRTLRMLENFKITSTGPKLTKFLNENFNAYSDKSILNYEENSFDIKKLSEKSIGLLRERYQQHDNNSLLNWEGCHQLELF